MAQWSKTTYADIVILVLINRSKGTSVQNWVSCEATYARFKGFHYIYSFESRHLVPYGSYDTMNILNIYITLDVIFSFELFWFVDRGSIRINAEVVHRSAFKK